jgi:hypothetical protein
MNVHSEQPFRKAFWTGVVDARPAALLRIGLGLLLVVDLCERLRDFHAFYTLNGLVPGPGEAVRLGLGWTLFSLATSPGATLALFLAGFPLALAFALGYRTRVANLLLWVFVVSLHHRNLHVCDGGDAVLQALLFWSIFVDTGAVLSLDVWLGRRARAPHVPALPFRAIQIQIALIYLITFVAKSGQGWREGTAVYQAVSNSDWGRGLGPLLAAHPALCRALTWATLAIEAAFPLLVFSPWRTRLTRTIAIASGLALHAGIFLTMRVGIFSQVMPLSYLAFVPIEWIAWAQRSFASRSRSRGGAGTLPGSPTAIDRVQAALARVAARRRWTLRPRAARPARPASAAWARAAAVVVGAQLALIGVDQVLRLAHVRPPSLLTAELTFVSQRQNWTMFAPDAPRVDITWRLPGALTDGGRAELTDAVMPELVSRDGFRYSRWHRLRNSLSTNPPDLLWPFGRYVCRRWRLRHPGAGARLARFELVARVRPLVPAGAAPEPRETVHYTQTCFVQGT